MKITNCIALFSAICLFISLLSSSVSLGAKNQLGFKTHMYFRFMNMKHRLQKNNQFPTSLNAAGTKLQKNDLPDLPIYYQGWLNYFHYVKNEVDKSKHFYKNEKFGKILPTNSIKTPDEFGSYAIPDHTSFFSVVYQDRMVLYSTREDGFLQGVDSLYIENVRTVPDDGNLKGSVKDLGKFAEGNCFEVTTKVAKDHFSFSANNPFPQEGKDIVWLFCSKNPEIKNKFMNLIIKLRLKLQHSVGLYYSKNDPDTKYPTIEKLASDESNIVKPGEVAKVKDGNDGYWVLLQDWSTCSKKCGGGLQFQQLMCVPPKKGGKVCEGPALRQKPCNPGACPQVNEAASLLAPKNKAEKMNKPIVKIMPISSRPIRYDKCHMKETDAIFTKYKEGISFTNNPAHIPSRVVMNSRSVSAYTDDTLQTNLSTFLLDKTEITRSAKKPHCFILTSPNAKGEFCNIDTNPKTNFVEEWDYDFNLFKRQCKTDRPTVSLDLKEEKELEKELRDNIQNAKLSIVKERAKRLKEKVTDVDAIKVQKTEEMALMAVQKEIKLEDLLEKEELEKEAAEEKELKVQIDNEKKKDECLIKSIKEKELEDQYNANKSRQEAEVESVKKEAQINILKKRSQIKIKIAQMRTRAARKKKILSNEIQTLRTTVANELTNLNKDGNKDNCFKANKETEKNVKMYCSNNFMDTPQKYAECIVIEDFCYVCCENEFGNMHLKQRDTCYNACESPAAAKGQSGSWVWQGNTSK